MKPTFQPHLQAYLRTGLTVLVAILPFHAFVTIALGHQLGHQALFQAWKEALILVLCLIAVLAVVLEPAVLNRLRQPFNLLAIAYVLLSLLVSLALGVTGESSWWYAVKANLVFITLFLMAQIAASTEQVNRFIKILLTSGAIVAGLAVIQALALPPDWLRTLGYSQATIEPLQLIDPAIKARRAFSTLGGPNQLGAFLILPISLTLHLWYRQKSRFQLALLALFAFALLLTFSRSAWIGAAAAGLVISWINLPPQRRKSVLPVAGIIFVLLCLLAFAALRRPSKLQYYLLHSQAQTYGRLGSDAERLAAFSKGLNQALEHPLGQGLGTAGPASLRHSIGLIPENYYLQIALEAGLVGLMLFLAFMTLTGLELLRLSPRQDLALPLFATLIGISLVNLFLHGWTDSTLAYIYWTMAGAAVGLANHTAQPAPTASINKSGHTDVKSSSVP